MSSNRGPFGLGRGGLMRAGNSLGVLTRAVRRRLHDAQPAEGGIREPYSTGVIAGLRKGLLVGTPRGPGRLCGITNGSFRYHDRDGKRQAVKAVRWVSSSFIIVPTDKPVRSAKPS
jgi:hypothetical protein